MLRSKIVFSLIFSILLLITSASASPSSTPKDYDAVVYSASNNRYKGFLEKVSEKGITIDFFGQSKFISADSIKSIKIKRRTALKSHALTGAAAGLLAGIPVYLSGNSQGKLSLLALPVVLIGTTLSGALLGSLVNTMTSVRKYQITESNTFKSIYPVLLRYTNESPSRTPDKE